MAKQRLTPQEFNTLDVSKKIHVLTLAYMAQCTTEGFSKKSLFALKRYFASKVDPVNYQCFFDYIYSLTEVTPTSLYDLYGKSQAWQLTLRMQSNAPEVEVAQYPSLLQCLNDL